MSYRKLSKSKTKVTMAMKKKEIKKITKTVKIFSNALFYLLVFFAYNKTEACLFYIVHLQQNAPDSSQLVVTLFQFAQMLQYISNCFEIWPTSRQVCALSLAREKRWAVANEIARGGLDSGKQEPKTKHQTAAHVSPNTVSSYWHSAHFLLFLSFMLFVDMLSRIVVLLCACICV